MAVNHYIYVEIVLKMVGVMCVLDSNAHFVCLWFCLKRAQVQFYQTACSLSFLYVMCILWQVLPSAVVSVYQNLYCLQVGQMGCVVTAFDRFLFYSLFIAA